MVVRPAGVNMGLPDGGTCNVRSQHTKDAPDGGTSNNLGTPSGGHLGSVGNGSVSNLCDCDAQPNEQYVRC
jgi:hypothetical protein